MNLKYPILIIYILYILDVLTTLYALPLGAVESNPYWYTLGPELTFFREFLFITIPITILIIINKYYTTYNQPTFFYSSFLGFAFFLISYSIYPAVLNNISIINQLGGFG